VSGIADPVRDPDGTLGCWRYAIGSVPVNRIASPRVGIFYWFTILFSSTLGTALGNFPADDSGLGYEGAALLFAGIVAVVAALYFGTRISRTLLFWMAFVLTRPLGATVGDILTKPMAMAALDLSRLCFVRGHRGFHDRVRIALTSRAAGGHRECVKMRDRHPAPPSPPIRAACPIFRARYAPLHRPAPPHHINEDHGWNIG